MGVFTVSRWKAGVFHGNGSQLHPSVKIYRALNQDHHYMYCNSKEKALGKIICYTALILVEL